MPADHSTPDVLLPAAYNRHAARWFGVWIERMFRRSWHAVRCAAGTQSTFAALDSSGRPAIVLMNHPSWWDPLIGMWLTRRLAPSRRVLGPMELAEFRKLGFFRWLGVFGLDPARPEALDAMTEYVIAQFRSTPQTVFWITPQGGFADVRAPVRLRPGAAALAARLAASDLGPPDVVACAVEPSFWVDSRPELCVRFQAVASGRPSTAGWHRVMTEAMQANADALASLVIARDPAAFDDLQQAAPARINPLVDLWLKLRGERGDLQPKRLGSPPPGVQPAPAAPAPPAPHDTLQETGR